MLASTACGTSGTEDPTSAVPPVPAIDNAKDARRADPCAVLSPDQLGHFGFTPPGTAGRTPEGLPTCEWRGARGTVLSMSLFLAPEALETLAQNSEPTTARVRLEGYPALETFTEHGRFCQYDVGSAPDQVVIGTMIGGMPDSCTALQAVLAAVLANLPPYQP